MVVVVVYNIYLEPQWGPLFLLEVRICLGGGVDLEK